MGPKWQSGLKFGPLWREETTFFLSHTLGLSAVVVPVGVVVHIRSTGDVPVAAGREPST
jgi:hypothetical protein